MVQNEETIGEVVLLKLLLDIKTFNKNCGIISRKINVYESFYNKDPYGFEFLDGVFNLKTDYDFNVEMGNKLQDYYNENVFKHSNLNPGLVRIINSNKNEIIEFGYNVNLNKRQYERYEGLLSNLSGAAVEGKKKNTIKKEYLGVY